LIDVKKSELKTSRATAFNAWVFTLLIQSNNAPLRLHLNSDHFASGGSAMTNETAKALLMILLFGSLSIALYASESSATKRLRVAALQALRRTRRG